MPPYDDRRNRFAEVPIVGRIGSAKKPLSLKPFRHRLQAGHNGRAESKMPTFQTHHGQVISSLVWVRRATFRTGA